MKNIATKNIVWILRNRTPLGWFQLRRDRTRLLVAMSGITFADVLIFMQLGFMNALYDTAVLTHNQLDADIVLMSPQARTLDDAKTFPRRRLYQVMDIPVCAISRRTVFRLCRVEASHHAQENCNDADWHQS